MSNPPDRPITRRGMGFIASAAVLWSSSGLFIKLLPLGPMTIAGARSGVAALTMLAVLWARGERRILRLDSLTFGAAAVYTGVLTLFVMATKLTTAANAIFLQFSAPIYLLFLEPLVLKTPFRRRDLVAVAACLACLGLFFLGKLQAGHLLGNLLALASGLCLAVFTLLLKMRHQRFPEDHPAGPIVLGNLLVAVVCLPWLGSLASITGPQASMLLYLGVFQIGFAYLLFSAGVRQSSATAAVIISTLEAVLNPVWVFLGIGERPSPLALLGGLAMLGLILWYGLGGGPREGVFSPEASG